jgi:hypothetical protein
MEAKTKRWLMGCGGGCGALVLLAVGSCAGFTAWLRAPGELLEPRQLLDPEAVGYAETRLELDNPGTEALVLAAVELLEAQRPPVDFPLADFFFRWNVARQERDLRRMFPARVAWTAYPSEAPGSVESVASFSIQRAGHQLVLADWLFEWGLGRAGEEAYLDHAGERVLVMHDAARPEEPDEADATVSDSAIELAGEPGEGEAAWETPPERIPRAHFLFLRGDGAFFGTGERAVRRAIDLLERPQVRAGWVQSRLGDLLATLPEDRQLRGAVLNERGELLSILEPILGNPSEAAAGQLESRDRDEWRAALAEVEAAIFSGGFEPDGAAVFELELLAAPEHRARLSAVIAETLAAADEELELERETVDTARGVRVRVRLADVPRVVREALAERLPAPGVETGSGAAP